MYEYNQNESVVSYNDPFNPDVIVILNGSLYSAVNRSVTMSDHVDSSSTAIDPADEICRSSVSCI